MKLGFDLVSEGQITKDSHYDIDKENASAATEDDFIHTVDTLSLKLLIELRKDTLVHVEVDYERHCLYGRCPAEFKVNNFLKLNVKTWHYC